MAIVLESSEVAGVGACGVPVNMGEFNGANVEVITDPDIFPDPSNRKFTAVEPLGMGGAELLKLGPVTGFPFTSSPFT